MKKTILLLLCLNVLILAVSGCQNSSGKNSDNTTGINKIENTTNIVIGYGSNSYAAMITNQEEINQLEDLFNGAEFVKSKTSTQQPYLNIAFYSKNDIASFYIDDKDTIQLRDGSHIKSEQVTFNKLYTIYKEYLDKKK